MISQELTSRCERGTRHNDTNSLRTFLQGLCKSSVVLIETLVSDSSIASAHCYTSALPLKGYLKRPIDLSQWESYIISGHLSCTCRIATSVRKYELSSWWKWFDWIKLKIEMNLTMSNKEIRFNNYPTARVACASSLCTSPLSL